MHPARFERATCRLEGGCSIQLSYGCLTPLVLAKLSLESTSTAEDAHFLSQKNHCSPRPSYPFSEWCSTGALSLLFAFLRYDCKRHWRINGFTNLNRSTNALLTKHWQVRCIRRVISKTSLRCKDVSFGAELTSTPETLSIFGCKTPIKG